MSATKFTVDETEFELSPLKITAQMKGWAIVGGIILPIFLGGGEFSAQGIQAALSGIDRINELYNIFAEVCKVQWSDKGLVPLKSFADNVFQRRSDLIVGFLAEAVFVEYGSFLDERGKSVLTQAASRFDSLLG